MYTVLTFRPEYQYPLYIVVRVRVLRSCARHAARFSSTGFRFKKVVFETLQPVPASPGRRSQTKKNLTAFRDIIGHPLVTTRSPTAGFVTWFSSLYIMSFSHEI